MSIEIFSYLKTSSAGGVRPNPNGPTPTSCPLSRCGSHSQRISRYSSVAANTRRRKDVLHICEGDFAGSITIRGRKSPLLPMLLRQVHESLHCPAEQPISQRSVRYNLRRNSQGARNGELAVACDASVHRGFVPATSLGKESAQVSNCILAGSRTAELGRIESVDDPE